MKIAVMRISRMGAWALFLEVLCFNMDMIVNLVQVAVLVELVIGGTC